MRQNSGRFFNQTSAGRTLALPARFGRYRLTELLAVGGMAEVYLAKSFGAAGFVKQLAIKRLAPDRARDAYLTRLFINEAKLLVTLTHSNIVPVFDFGRVGEDLFIAMEWVAGPPLRDVLEALTQHGERMGPLLAAHVAAEICRGLHYAHTRVDARGRQLEIIHRDIKPTNVLLSVEGEVKIVDFGVAKLTDRHPDHRLVGTLAYMSPEQAQGRRLDRRTDLFSAGLVLYEMLAGRRAYEGANSLKVFELARQACVPTLPKAVPEPLRNVVSRATHARIEARYASAREMEQELAAYLLQAQTTTTTSEVVPPAVKLSALIAKLGLLPSANGREAPGAVVEEPHGGIPPSGSVDDVGDTDPDLLAEAAETFHSEFLTLALQHELRHRRVVRLRWLSGGLLLVSSVLLALAMLRPNKPPGPSVTSLSERSSLADLADAKPAPTSSSATVKQGRDSGSAHAPQRWSKQVRSRPRLGKRARSRPRRARGRTSRRISRTTPVAVRGYGFLDLNSTPWSEVSIDRGKPLPTPLFGHRLTVGWHVVVLRNPQRSLSKTIRVRIRPGLTTRKAVRLE